MSQNSSDNFPDLSLPERSGVPEPMPVFKPQPLPSRSSKPNWREGDRVLAPWEPQFLYVGRIMDLQEDQALIHFEDGDEGWVFENQIRPLQFKPGQQAFSRRQMGLVHFPCTILDVRGEIGVVSMAVALVPFPKPAAVPAKPEREKV